MGKKDIQRAYMGQEPPGLVPIPFAPEILSIKPFLHCYPTITYDGNEIFWTTLDKGSTLKIMPMKEDVGFWTPPQTASFSGVYIDQFPLLSQDDQRIYFSSVRPKDAGVSTIWFSESRGDGWSEPQLFTFPPNSGLGATQNSLLIWICRL